VVATASPGPRALRVRGEHTGVDILDTGENRGDVWARVGGFAMNRPFTRHLRRHRPWLPVLQAEHEPVVSPDPYPSPQETRAARPPPADTCTLLPRTERGIEVDHVTVFGWDAALHTVVDRRGPAVPDRCFADETSVKVAGWWVWLDRAIDQFGRQVIDVLVARKRDLAGARRFFTRMLRHGSRPTEVAVATSVSPPPWHHERSRKMFDNL